MSLKIQEQLNILSTNLPFFGGKALLSHLNALEQIGEIGSTYDAIYIFRYVFSNKKIIAEKAAQIIRQLMIKRPIKGMRYSVFGGSFNHHDGYMKLDQDDFQKLSNFAPKYAAHLCGLASINNSGYVREQALDYFERIPSSEVLPYIFLRLNDWVPQVRKKAMQVIQTKLPEVCAVEIIKYYHLVEWLRHTNRVNLSWLYEIILEKIRHPENRESVLNSIKNCTLQERVFCWKILSTEIHTDHSLIDEALRDPAPEVRQLIPIQLPHNTKLYPEWISILLKDKSVRVRYAALKSIPRDQVQTYSTFFDQALFDDARSIREFAQFIIRSFEGENIAQRYQAQIKNDKANHSIGLISGFAETCKKEEIPQIIRYINHHNYKVRLAILLACYRLRVENIDDLCLRGLQDTNAKVRNACVLFLLQSGYSHLRSSLRDLFKYSNYKTKQSVLKVLVYNGALESLQDILYTFTESNDDLHKIAERYLLSWYGQYTRLRFTFSDRNYQSVMQLLERLKSSDVKNYTFSFNSWDNLSNLMIKIRKISINIGNGIYSTY